MGIFDEDDTDEEWDKELSILFDNANKRINAEYDGVLGELPEWLQDDEGRKFASKRSKLLEIAKNDLGCDENNAHKQVIYWMARHWESELPKGTERPQLLIELEVDIKAEDVKKQILPPPKFWDDLDYLINLYIEVKSPATQSNRHTGYIKGATTKNKRKVGFNQRKNNAISRGAVGKQRKENADRFWEPFITETRRLIEKGNKITKRNASQIIADRHNQNNPDSKIKSETLRRKF